jgi:hypothetical protein
LDESQNLYSSNQKFLLAFPKRLSYSPAQAATGLPGSGPGSKEVHAQGQLKDGPKAAGTVDVLA